MERGSYLLLTENMRVRGQDGSDLGTITEVVADANADIFRGVMLSTGLFEVPVFVPGDHVVSVVEDIATLDLDRNGVDSLRPTSEGQ